MKKRFIALLMTMAVAANMCCSCGKKEDEKSNISLETKMSETAEMTVVDAADPDFTAEEWAAMQPQEIQIRNICELATMEVYFHSVAKAVKPAASGMSGFGQEDRRFWFERICQDRHRHEPCRDHDYGRYGYHSYPSCHDNRRDQYRFIFL